MKLPTFEFYHRLSRREQVLLLVVAGAGLLILNLLALSTALRASRALGSQLAEKSQQVRIAGNFAREQPLWARRAGWLKAHQPVLTNRDRAEADLKDFVQGEARADGLVLTNPAFKRAQPTPGGGAARAAGEYQAVTMSFEAQGDWGALVHFLAKVQRPESFLVFEDTTLKTDENDATRMKCSFLLSKWYAPAGR